MHLGGKNFTQMVEQLTPEEISATFSEFPALTQVKEVKLSKFDRCHLLDALVEKSP